MFNLKEKINSSEFAKNLVTLLSGSVIAQVIPIAIMPLLTRIYTPSDFGVFGLYTAMVAVLSIIVTGRYELAIMLPKQEDSANHLVNLSLIFTVVISIVTLVVILLFGNNISVLLGSEDLNKWLLFIPLSVFVAGVYQTFFFWNNRQKKYKSISVTKVAYSSSTAVVNLSGNLFNKGALGLVLGAIIGQINGAIILFFRFKKAINNSWSFNFTKSKLLAIEYIDFLRFSTISGLINSFSNTAFPIVIGMFFDVKVVGLYFFANKLTRLPLNFIFTSLSQVYHQKAVELFHSDKKELYRFTMNTQKKIAILLFPILVGISIIGPFAFDLFFGSEWKESGSLIKYFALFVFFGNLYSPISSIADILNKQKVLMYFNASLVFSQIIVMYMSVNLFNLGFNETILNVSLIGSLHFIILSIFMNRTLSNLK